MTVDALIDGILLREGGYSDHPSDRGGATKFGITKGTLTRWRGHHVTIADVKALTEDEARDIYVTQYIVQPGFGSLPDPLRVQVVDFGVTSGSAQAVKTLQRVLGHGLRQDGVLGVKTRTVLAAGDVDRVTRQYWQERVRFYAHVAAMRASQMDFLDGWLNRCFGMQP